MGGGQEAGFFSKEVVLNQSGLADAGCSVQI